MSEATKMNYGESNEVIKRRKSENKVKEYIERATEIDCSIYGTMPDDNGTRIMTIAQMLQREEHFNQGSTEITGGFNIELQEVGRLEVEHFNKSKE